MTNKELALIMRYAETGNADSKTLALFERNPNALSFARALRDDLLAMDAVPDSNLANEITQNEYADIALRKNGLAVLAQRGMTLLSPVPVRGRDAACASIAGSAFRIEYESERTVRIVIFACEKEARITTKKGAVVYERKGRARDIVASHLTSGAYLVVIDGISRSIVIRSA